MAARSYSDAEIAAIVFEQSKRLDQEIAKLKAERNDLYRQHHGIPHPSERLKAVTASPRCKDCLEVLPKKRWQHYEVCSVCQHRRMSKLYRDKRRRDHHGPDESNRKQTSDIVMGL